MPVQEDPRATLERQFIEIASRYTAEGWVEFLLWETIEGKRDRPFKFFDVLPPAEMEILRRLRDEAKMWIFWQNGVWCHTAIDVWRTYAAENDSNTVFNRLQNGS